MKKTDQKKAKKKEGVAATVATPADPLSVPAPDPVPSLTPIAKTPDQAQARRAAREEQHNKTVQDYMHKAHTLKRHIGDVNAQIIDTLPILRNLCALNFAIEQLTPLPGERGFGEAGAREMLLDQREYLLEALSGLSLCCTPHLQEVERKAAQFIDEARLRVVEEGQAAIDRAYQLRIATTSPEPSPTSGTPDGGENDPSANDPGEPEKQADASTDASTDTRADTGMDAVSVGEVPESMVTAIGSVMPAALAALGFRPAPMPPLSELTKTPSLTNDGERATSTGFTSPNNQHPLAYLRTNKELDA